MIDGLWIFRRPLCFWRARTLRVGPELRFLTAPRIGLLGPVGKVLEILEGAGPRPSSDEQVSKISSATRLIQLPSFRRPKLRLQA